jgi:hypothetical protein
LLLLFSDEVRLAARLLFDAGVDSLTDEEKISLVGRWQHSRKALAICRAWVLTTDFGQPNSTLLTPGPGKKVTRRLKSFASLRIYCRWPTWFTFSKVPFFSSDVEGILIELLPSEVLLI